MEGYKIIYKSKIGFLKFLIEKEKKPNYRVLNNKIGQNDTKEIKE
jgi:hypothetical protein